MNDNTRRVLELASLITAQEEAISSIRQAVDCEGGKIMVSVPYQGRKKQVFYQKTLKKPLTKLFIQFLEEMTQKNKDELQQLIKNPESNEG